MRYGRSITFTGHNRRHSYLRDWIIPLDWPDCGRLYSDDILADRDTHFGLLCLLHSTMGESDACSLSAGSACHPTFLVSYCRDTQYIAFIMHTTLFCSVLLSLYQQFLVDLHNVLTHILNCCCFITGTFIIAPAPVKTNRHGKSAKTVLEKLVLG